MKKFLRLMKEITIDALMNIIYMVHSNLLNFANVLNLVLPYLMYFIGQALAEDRGYIAFGGEIFIPVFFFVIIYYFRSMADRTGKGSTVPIPNKRFTQVDDDGEVSIENSRIQELILYMADLEDWLDRKGIS